MRPAGPSCTDASARAIEPRSEWAPDRPTARPPDRPTARPPDHPQHKTRTPITRTQQNVRLANLVRVPNFTVLPQPRVYLGERRYTLQLFPLLLVTRAPVLDVLILGRMILGRGPRRTHVAHDSCVVATPTASGRFLLNFGAENPLFVRTDANQPIRDWGTG